MELPDLNNADLSPDEQSAWLMSLLMALGDRAEQMVPLLSEETVESMLNFLANTLKEAEEDGSLPETWRGFLRLD